MEAPRSGFLIVSRFEELYRNYCRRIEKIARDHRGVTDALIYSVPQQGRPFNEVAKKYRGIDRVPLVPWPSRRFPDETWMGREEPQATQALDDLETSSRAQEGFILSLSDANEVFSLLQNPERWELIWAGNSNFKLDKREVGATLGFEPTWFVGDHFSAVCDGMCFPRWHGTDQEGVLFSEHYDRLNEHALFKSHDEAETFLTSTVLLIGRKPVTTLLLRFACRRSLLTVNNPDGVWRTSDPKLRFTPSTLQSWLTCLSRVAVVQRLKREICQDAADSFRSPNPNSQSC